MIEQIITHDDCIYFQSIKTDNTGKSIVKLTNDYRNRMNIDKADKPSGYYYKDCLGITHYLKTREETPKEYIMCALPYYPRKLNLKNNSLAVSDGNRFMIRVLKLFSKPIETRYRIMVDLLVELVSMGILEYNPRVDNPSEKNILEAMRNRGLRDFKVCRYEHNTLFRPELGKLIFDTLKASKEIDPKDIIENTIYLRTAKQINANKQRILKGKKPLKALVKFYHMKEKHGIDMYKLEVTIDKTQIKNQSKAHKNNNSIPDLRSIKTYLDQPNIQDIDFVHKQIKSGINLLLEHCNNEVIDIMKKILEVTNKKDIAEKILDPFYTLKEVLKRVDVLESDNEKIKNNQSKILKHLGLNED